MVNMTNFDDPLYLILNVVALAAIGTMIWFGYKFMNKGSRDGGIKVRGTQDENSTSETFVHYIYFNIW